MNWHIKLSEVIIFPFLNTYLPEFYDPPTPENLRSHCSNSNENATSLQSNQAWKCDPTQRHIPISLLLGSTPRGFLVWLNVNVEKRVPKLMGVPLTAAKETPPPSQPGKRTPRSSPWVHYLRGPENAKLKKKRFAFFSIFVWFANGV